METCRIVEPGLLDISQRAEREPAAAARPARSPGTIALLGVAFDALNAAQALEKIEELVASGRSHFVVTANVDFLVQAQGDVELRWALADASLVLCDGTPLVWASRWLGHRLPERVAGSDLAPALIRLAVEKKYRLFFLGATPEANETAVVRVRSEFPGVIIAGHYSPPFMPLPEFDHEEIARRIRTARPDLLMVAFGCSKAEKWMAMCARSLGVPVSIGVGATLDFLAGRMKRAPLWMRRAGLEWVYRLCQEPRRLWRRYARDLWRFGVALAAQWWRLRARSSRDATAEPPFNRIAATIHAGSMERQEVRVSGRLDGHAFQFGNGFERLSPGCGYLLDLPNVTYVDSAGVGFLLSLRRQIVGAGGRMVLVAPNGPVERALGWLRVRELFAVARDIQQARRLME
jgi:N-acetylglucosaminyldiphosphoundecaprenol N-acetyl-beta-D-mannosaminyltransferase